MNDISKKIPCSVGILTFNREKELQITLESVKDFAEIIVCDGGSTDNTVEVARRFGCKTIEQDNMFKNLDNSVKDFAGVRNQLLDTSSHDWFLFVDSDEYLSNKVVYEIEEIVRSINTKHLVYDLPRKYVVNGKVVDCASTYPNYQNRFFNKKAVNKFIKKVHERIDIKGGYMKGKLINCEYVPVIPIKEALIKWNYQMQIDIDKNKNQSFSHWLRYLLFNTSKTSAIYLFRFIKITLFCKGKKMPMSYELFRHWYNLKLIFLTGKKFLGLK